MAPKITQSLIPKGSRNRPGYKLTPKKITIHDTANPSKGADAAAHAVYFKSATAAAIPASVHFVVDGGVDGKKSPAIYQLLPLNENGWHCGDGTNGPGNRTSIGIEICENKDGNRAVAEANAAWLTAKLLKDYKLKIVDVKQHYDWNGKNCPNVLRGRKNGWAVFLTTVEKNLNPPKLVQKLPIITREIGINLNNKAVKDEVGFLINNATYVRAAYYIGHIGGDVIGLGDRINIVLPDIKSVESLSKEVTSLKQKIKNAAELLSG